jgi:hypothetical protein
MKVNKGVNLESLIKEANEFTEEGYSYYISYKEFLKYFENQERIELHNLVIGINFTYGWMPTIFDFRSTNFDAALEVLNKAKCNIKLIYNDYQILKTLFNNSLVGTSKLLHFINPEKYAIWDSRVFRYLYDKEPHDYRIGKIENYIEYLTLLENLTKELKFNDFQNIINSKLKYNVTKFRALEMIMFTNGKKVTH